MALIDQIIGVESDGNPLAKNPRSSAAGLGQFIDSTWLAMLAKHRPDIQGSPQELLALKSDPALSREMTAAYARDNGAVLSGADVPVTAGTTYLAHFAGPQGAVKVLQADPSAPIEGILEPRAIAANPFLRGMTAADLRAWADRKMGGAASSKAQQPASASPASPQQPIPQRSAFAFAPQQSAQPAPDYFSQFPVDQILQAPPPIFAAPRRPPPDLRALRAALARPSAGFLFSRG